MAVDHKMASTRYRLFPLKPELERRGWRVVLRRFPRRPYFFRTWRLRHQLRSADVVVLQKVKLSWPEAWLLRLLARRTVLDFDDAIYLRKPRAPGGPAQDTWWRRKKFEATCRAMDVAVAGNQVLAEAAGGLAGQTEVLPTAIDLGRYSPTPRDPAELTILVWIGWPENLISLELIRPVLARIAQAFPEMRLRVICSRFPDWPEIPIEQAIWSSDTEVGALTTADIGLMPLANDEWSRGKCAFKLLQYMAAGLPCVASPVGANTTAVVERVTGFLPNTDEEWFNALYTLVGDAALRRKMGQAGRRHAEENFALPTYSRRYVDLLEEQLLI